MKYKRSEEEGVMAIKTKGTKELGRPEDRMVPTTLWAKEVVPLTFGGRRWYLSRSERWANGANN